MALEIINSEIVGTIDNLQDKIDGKHFGGIYDKSKKLEELLKGLEETGLVKFKVEEGNSSEERRVIVME